MIPIEIWLTKKNLQVRCMVVYNDEQASTLAVKSLSMRGAQREIRSRDALQIQG